MSFGQWPPLRSGGQILAEVRGRLGVVTLNRPGALNALSLEMIRDITALLLHWAEDDEVHAVLVRGAGREGKAPAFCAGGDIRFFHQAALAGDPRLEDFFTEEYALNHLIHTYRKPYVALMDGVVMGGGMGISQGASHRVVTEHSKLAMPETNIGLFPDVGGGWFLGRCPGHVGEYLALTGSVVGAADAIAFGLGDRHVPSSRLEDLLTALSREPALRASHVDDVVDAHSVACDGGRLSSRLDEIEQHFRLPELRLIMESLAQTYTEFARQTLEQLQMRSPLMMAVTLEQVRRARSLTLAEELRMERDMVRHCFHLRPGAESETVEGIRALAVDKDHRPSWNPETVQGVDPEHVEAFFQSPWPEHAHPLRALV